MTEHLWRLSGRDGRQHAFLAHGGFIPTCTHTAYLVVPDPHEEAMHPASVLVELYESACHQHVPVTALMPHTTGPVCVNCALMARSDLHIATPTPGITPLRLATANRDDRQPA